ncbi:MAG TPA: 23S rRNA (guanosine(2251)-2'-O)-methyltransferase RlmB [Candidatus Thermoplasmatota archaeon]|nr:23S rRNA (guanosine(2251)-2'-O)-methyltransferase RlmB [Candidatus Thermoplasmatota archaeon]
MVALPQLEILYGKNPVLEAIRAARSVVEVHVAEGSQASAQTILAAARDEGIPIKVVTKKSIEDKARGQVHQGIIAFVKARDFATVEELLEVARQKKQDLLLVAVDGIEDPQNLGAILRSAEAAGAHGVILATRGTTTITPTVVKASAGASEHLKVARVPSLPNALLDLKRKEVWIGGTDPREGKLYYEAKMDGPLVLVIGSEARGMSPLVRDRCDFLVRVPMKGKVESLNASAACAVLLMERLRQIAQAKR